MDDTLVFIIFAVISFLSWLFSQLKENKKPQNKKRRPAKKNMDLGDEIENFLKEISGEKPAPKKQKPAIAKKPKPRPQKKPVIVKEQVKPVSTPVGNKQIKRFETNISRQHLEDKKLGSQLGQHVMTYMDHDIKDHVTQHLKPNLDDSVSSHLGQFSRNFQRAHYPYFWRF